MDGQFHDRGDEGNSAVPSDGAEVRPVTGTGRTVRTEGQRRLLALVDQPTVICQRLDVAKGLLSQWRSGTKTPGPSWRLGIEKVYGIEPRLWDLAPGASPPPPSSVPPMPSATPEGGPVDTLTEVDRQLALLRRDLDRAGDLAVTERVRGHNAIAGLLRLRAAIEKDAELLEDRVVTEHPMWRRVRTAILAALKGHPDALRAVADALEELGA